LKLGGAFFTIGQGVAASFLAGVTSLNEAAASAASAMGDSLRGQLDSGLKGSPKYFTYYLGQELVGQLYDGMNKKGRIMKPIVLAGGGTGRSPTASIDRVAHYMHQDRHKPKFHRDRHQAVKLDSYLVGRAQRMDRLRKEDRP
jgi:hypothetical protein